MKWRLLFLIILLIAACFYRYPVKIQKLKIETMALLNEAIIKGKALISKENEKIPTSETKPAVDRTKVVVIKLKNMRRIEGIIREDTGQDVMLDVGGGIVGISKTDIEKIETPADDERKRILKELGRSEADLENGGGVTEIRYLDSNRITVEALLNDKVKATLILDTGAPYVSITPQVANQLFDVEKVVSKTVDMKWSDGGTTPGKLVLLESVKVGNAKINNVEAVISKTAVLESGTDGLLGMSFLNYFKVNIDGASKKIILGKK